MNIEFVARHVDLNDGLRGYAEEKLAKVLKFLREPVEIHLTLESENRRQIAELRIAHRHGQFHAREEDHDLREALGTAVEAIEKQARRARKRSLDRRRRAGREAAIERQWPIEILASDSFAAGHGVRVVETAMIRVLPMSIDEAAGELAVADHGFVLFRDAESSELRVLYRRQDGNFGLVSPEI